MENRKSIGFVRKQRGSELQIALQNDLFDLADPDCLFIEASGIAVPCFIESIRYKGEDICCTFHDMPSERALQTMVGGRVYVELDEQQLNSYDNDSSDITGYAVKNEQGAAVGIVKDIDTTTTNTLLLLDNDIILPYHKDLLVGINHNERTVTMHIPEGLVN